MGWDKKKETRQDIEKTLDGFFKKTNQPKNYIINYFYSATMTVLILIILVLIKIIAVVIV